MLFYKVEAQLSDKQTFENKAKEKEYARTLSEKMEMFYQHHAKTVFLFIAFIKKQTVTLGAITRAGSIPEDVIPSFLDMAELSCTGFHKEEITLKALANLLSVSSRNDYIRDDDEVLESFELEELANRSSFGRFVFEESIVQKAGSRAELLKTSAKLLCEKTLSPEIRRIYCGGKLPNAYGHPVHYLIETDARSVREKMISLLLSALYANRRIKSQRYCSVSCGPHTVPPQAYYDLLYKSCTGGALVASYLSQDVDSDEYAQGNAEIIIRMCEMMQKYKNDVLTVFCLPRSCESLKNTFMENLGDTTLVIINEETVCGKQAKAHLRQLALNHGIPTDRSLYKQVRDPERGYLAADLESQFDFWLAGRLKTAVYPQYAALEAANQNICASKPKGSAYDELQKMVGLTEAKSLIGQALDFYKAQKLFREKGMRQNHLAMHMVFTGNPGTAKTTVARLFARILKDNGILSKGELYECGRADLVGKYVGWTAQLVQKKFQAAQGSVLFIDEAYSLVDGKAGLYGDEAINTIVQEMENRRKDMIVIFAGYPEPMETFLRTNPGLRSRIAFQVPFRDYDAEELWQITSLFAEEEGVSLADGVHEKLLPIFQDAARESDFGNGRFARNLLEKARMKQAGRLVHTVVDCVSQADVTTLLPEDFECPIRSTQSKKPRIGFFVD